MKKLIASTLLTLLAGTVPAAEKFNFQTEVEIKADRSETELIKVPIPQKILPALRYDFNDMRIVTSKGKSVPFTLLQDKRVIKEPYNKFYKASASAIKLTENEISAVINFEKARVISAIRVETPLHDFEFAVSVYKPNGDAIVENRPIFDYSSFTESRSEIVNFPPVRQKSLKIVIKGLSKLQKQQLFELKEISGENGLSSKEQTSHINLQKPRFSFYMGEQRFTQKNEMLIEQVATELVKWETSSSGGKTVIRINTGRMPITRLVINTEEQNFSRPVTIKTLEAGQHRRHIYSGKIEKWNYKRFRENRTTLDFHRLSTPEVELTIHNGTNTPLTVKDISFYMPKYSIYFLEEPGKEYLLRYGNSSLTSRHSQLPKAILDQGMDLAITGKVTIPETAEEIAIRKRQFNSNYITTPVIAIIIAFLIWTIVSTMKKAEKEV